MRNKSVRKRKEKKRKEKKKYFLKFSTDDGLAYDRAGNFQN
jgi:hypothetical protein